MAKLRKGDTLVEVMFAVGIFGLIAVGAIALMNRGLSISQNTLETTMARQEIDAQIESLRFIHDAYISESKQDDSTYRGIWNTITQYAYDSDDSMNGILKEDEDFYGRVVENDKSCDAIFTNGFPSKSFVVNPRKLDSSVADEDTVVYYDDTIADIREASVYPRLIYSGGDSENLSDAEATDTGVSYQEDSTLTAAEGIWVTAVVSDSEVKNEPDFYDFYVHTCWNRAGGSGSTTINSILRLYNPDQIVYDTRTKVNGYALIFDANGGVTVPQSQTYDDITYPRHTFTITDEIPTWDSVHRFIGWSRDENAVYGSYFPGDDLTVYQYKTKLYAVWELAWNFTLSYSANTGTLPDGFTAVDKYGPTFDETHTFTIPNEIPTKTGYTFLGWAESANGPVKYAPGETVTLPRAAPSKTLYAKWKIISSPCVKQYRLQNANGTYPSTYTIDSTEMLDYGMTCSYTKSVNYYTTKSASQVMGVTGVTLSLDLPRTMYTLTVNRNTSHIASVSGGGMYRWGQSVVINAVAATGHSFTSWSQTGTAGTFANANAATTTFTMGKGNTTVTASGKINQYSVDVNPVINGVTYGGGLSGYTFDVYVNNVLVANDVQDYNQSLDYGSVVRVVGNSKTGYALTNGDVTKTLGTSSITFNPTWSVNSYTCTKRYRLQNADGTYPSTYTADGSQAVNFGETCSYSKSVSYYVTKSTSGTMTTSGLTLSLDLPRNTYTLTVNRDTSHISSASGTGTYRWGQSVSISATAATGHSFTSWSQSGTAGTFGNANAASTTFTMGKGNATVTAGGKINAYTCTKRYRLQNADGSYPSTYTSDGTQSINYGATCSYSKTVDYYVTQSTSGTMGTSGLTLSLDLPRVTYTCSKRYRLQNADGNYGSWVNDGTATLRWGATCSYSKTVADYQTKSASITMGKANGTVEVSLPRNTYTLTVNRDTNHISSVTGTGTYRWGQSVSISATAATGHSFTSWSQSGTAGTFGNANAASTTFTMGKGNATVTAGGKINAYTCTKRYRLQNADGSYPSSYTADGTQSVNYGATCSYSKSVSYYTTKSTSGTMGTSGLTLSLDLPRTTYTCSKRYRLQNADGSYGSWTNDGSAAVRWGATCSYSKSATDYQTKSSSITMDKANATVEVSLPRNTYTLTVSRDSNHISSVSGGGTYRWGQSVAISASVATGHSFNGWTQSGTSVTIANASAASTTVTMGKGNTTVTAGGKTNSYTCTKRYRLQNADGSYPSSYTADGTQSIAYGATCSYSKSVTNYQTKSTSGTMGTSGLTLSLDLPRNTYTCTKQYRLENADGSWGGWTNDGTASVRWGATCSYSKSVTDYQSKSASITMGTANGTVQVSLPRNTYTCTKQYRLQNADGSYGGWTNDGTASVRWGGTCSYSKSVSYYQTKNGSITMGKANGTVQVSLPRNTYSLTVNRNTSYISSVSGGGTYRWGQGVSISATAAANSAFNGWSLSSGTAGTFANASSASTTFTMGQGNAVIYANGKSVGYGKCSNVATCMQKTSSCDTTLYDARDGNAYTVRTINGKCWMTSNLRVTGSISATDSNFSSPSSFNVSQADLSNTAYCDGNNSYYYSCSRTVGSNVWYNYVAASAGSITGNVNYNNATSDICPSGWRLPTNSEISGIRSYVSLFSPVTGGYQYGGALHNVERGYWWTSDAGYGSYRWAPKYEGGTLYDPELHWPWDGNYIRCIRN